MENNKLVVFDLDGTLSVTYLYSVPAQRKALAEFTNRAYTDQELVSTLGERGYDYARRLLPGLTDQDYDLYLRREFYWEEVLMPENCGAFPGTREMLETLHALGYRTAVCSNAPQSYIDMVLGNLGLAQLIDATQPLLPGLTKVDTLGLLLKREKPLAAVMVGDRIYDMEAGHGNRLPFIGCLYGFNPAEVSSADFCAQIAADVVTGVQRLMG